MSEFEEPKYRKKKDSNKSKSSKKSKHKHEYESVIISYKYPFLKESYGHLGQKCKICGKINYGIVSDIFVEDEFGNIHYSALLDKLITKYPNLSIINESDFLK